MTHIALARTRIRGSRVVAVAVQLAHAGLLAVLYFSELLLTVAADRVWPRELSSEFRRGAVLLAILLMDLLLISPLYVGRAAFYLKLAGQQQASGRIIWQQYVGRRYWRAVAWRLQLWGRRLLWAVPCFLPGVALYAWLRWQLMEGVYTPADQIIMLATTLFCLAFLLIGLVAWQLLCLRYMPALYLISRQQGPVREAFRASSRMMKGQTGACLTMYIQYAWCLVASLLVVPFVLLMPLFFAARALWVLERCPVPPPR